MSTRQLEHQEIKNQQHNFPLVLVCHNISSPENMGMLFRISEAMGVEHLYLCGDTPTPEHRRVQKTSRSTQKYIKHSYTNDASVLVQNLKNEGYTLIALEVTNNSQVLSKVDFRSFEKFALIPGNEQHGVAPELLNLVDLSIEIPMYGKNTSINVVNAVSITLYEIAKQLS